MPLLASTVTAYFPATALMLMLVPAGGVTVTTAPAASVVTPVLVKVMVAVLLPPTFTDTGLKLPVNVVLLVVLTFTDAFKAEGKPVYCNCAVLVMVPAYADAPVHSTNNIIAHTARAPPAEADSARAMRAKICCKRFKLKPCY